ncbi:hypothetical protein CC2G_007390 [Coprinopsis cinerea AmutBmut pab1-1]|nr:hypothetical protein CC2G_007390 [Coprinopsis cinerea AmutBmut pab1-1]
MASYIVSPMCLPSPWTSDPESMSSWLLLNQHTPSTKATHPIQSPSSKPSQYSHSIDPSTKPHALENRNVVYREGGLEQIMDMPLDIICEVSLDASDPYSIPAPSKIFMHLGPMDLLNLSRTSRCLRALLLSREKTRSIWRSALGRIEGLPSCPSDLNEPQYTRLIFDESCHFCLARNIKEVYWTCRVRCCSRCIKQQCVEERCSLASSLCLTSVCCAGSI